MPESSGDAGDGAMGYDDGATIHVGEVTGGSSSLPPQIDEDTMWGMNFRDKEAMEAGPYPERPGEQDCAYYVRTGLCRFGMTCRFNHPLNRKLAVAAARIRGGYPERVGQSECQYYLKTGTCKFGATCKFHHPKDKAGIAGRAQLNSLGYPLRPNEMECAYYLRTGQCKFGNTCKFHHPQPSNTMVAFHGSPIYSTVHSPTAVGQQSYSGMTSWPISRASYTSSYAQMIVPQSLVPVPGWNAYSGQPGSVSSPKSQQQLAGNSLLYSSSRQNEAANTGAQGAFSSYHAGSIPMGLYAFQRENIFPDRPGEPECLFYMKTGDCKFGSVCRYHHPRERLFPVPDCVLSPLGLPLRPGEPLCIFYSRYGICKFGPNCKFDHPVGTLMYDLSVSPTAADVPVLRRLMTSGTTALPLSSEEDTEEAEENSRQPDSRQTASVDENAEADGSDSPQSIEPISSFS